MNKVLVSGANGFIGRKLCEALQTRGVRVFALTHRPADGPWDDHRVMDLTASLPTVDELAGVDTIFHLAAKAHALSERQQDEAEYHLINTEVTRRLLQLAATAGIRRFVYFSSVKAMGDRGSAIPLDENSPCQPDSPYGVSKLRAEKLVLDGGFVAEGVVLRPCMVYGDREKGNLPRMVRAIRQGRMPPLPDFGNRRAMVHVDDVVQAALLAAELPQAAGQVYIVHDGRHYSTRFICDTVYETMGRTPPRWSIPLSLLRIMARVGDYLGFVLRRRAPFDSSTLQRLSESACYSSAKIERELGFKARWNLGDYLRQ